jgi:hypothetical protein
MQTIPAESTTDLINSESNMHRKYPITTINTMPNKTGKISTQTLLSPSNAISNTHLSSHSFGWLSRLSNRFNSSTSTVRSTNKTSSTGLIFENRPNNLPPKSTEETLKHQVEYQKMCLEAKRAQQLYDEKEQQRQHLKLKREEFVSKSLQIWTNEILPNWNKYGGIHQCDDHVLNSKAYKLWWHGLPPRTYEHAKMIFNSFDDVNNCRVLSRHSR